jgi:2-dehydro-3-deoxyglucarate aldolase
VYSLDIRYHTTKKFRNDRRAVQEKQNSLKTRLSQSGLSLGIWCSLGSAMCAEVVAGSGSGWLLIDVEHGPNDVRSVVAQLQAVAQHPVEAVVRLPSDDPILIKQFMDAGARSLMIPNVRAAGQAREVVAAMRYPPEGVRGFSIRHRANGFGRMSDYRATAQAQQFLAVQIECAEGVANSAEIAAVNGVDALFVGPGDLSAHYELAGDPAGELHRAIHQVIGAATAAGKTSGIFAPVALYAQHYVELGYRMVAIGSDVGLLAAGSDALIAAFKGQSE